MKKEFKVIAQIIQNNKTFRTNPKQASRTHFKASTNPNGIFDQTQTPLRTWGWGRCGGMLGRRDLESMALEGLLIES